MSLGLGESQIANGPGGAASAALGSSQYLTEGIRYNGNGFGAGAFIAIGSAVATVSSVLAGPRIGQTSVDAPLCTIGKSAVASAATSGIAIDTDGINSGIVKNVLRKFSCRVQLGQTTNARYWIGLFASGSGPVGSAAALVTDNPNVAVAAFRFSPFAPDGNMKAYLAQSSAVFSVADTGVPIANLIGASHLFEISYNVNSGLWNFYIDAVLVASFLLNGPTATTLLDGIITVDNNNAANVASFNFGWMLISYY